MPEAEPSLRNRAFAAAVVVCATLSIAAPCAAVPRIPPVAPCIPPKPMRPGTPTAPDAVIVVLPRKLDPQGCPVRARRGTRVFRTDEQWATWTTAGPRGTGQTNYALPGLVVGVRRSGLQMLLELRDGTRVVLPGNAVIHPPDGSHIAFDFVANDQPIPRAFQGRLPDYVVP